ncbi:MULTISPECIES: tape measure protein [Pseudomonas]|uniref:tape measure protein n=1 Tax=Pseudomonas TaxID=286 RepID=UPI0021F8DB96|nr:tape measure protein [Pseudomonas putida]
MTTESRLAITIDSRAARQQADVLRGKLAALTGAGDDAADSIYGLGPAAKAAAAAMASIGVSQLTNNLLRATDRFKTMAGQIGLVSASTAEAARTFETLKAMANETGSSLESTVSLFTRMSNATKGAGFSQEQLLKATDAVNKAFLVSSATQQEATAASIQLSQAMASGTLRGEELNSVMEQAPRITRALSEYLGVTNGQIRAMAAEGKITSEVVMNALLRSLSSLNKEVASMPPLFERASQVMKNNFLAAVGQINVDPAISAMTSLGDAFANPQIINGMQTFSSSLASIAGVGVKGFEGVISNMDAILALTGAYATSVGVRLTSSLTLSAQARLADFSATMQQVTASRAVAAADLQASQISVRRAVAEKQLTGAKLARANVELQAARGTNAETFALQAQVAAASENRTATIALTQAKIAQTAAEASLTATATRGAAARTAVMAAFGGPVGLATAAVSTLAGAMIYFGSGTDTATQALIDQNLTLDESISKFKTLTAEQKRFQSATWMQAQRDATAEADKALKDYFNRAFQGLSSLGAPGVEAVATFRDLFDEVKNGQRSLDSLTSWITSNTSIASVYQDELVKIAAGYADSSSKAADYEQLLGRSKTATTAAASAADSLAKSQAGVGASISSTAGDWNKYIQQLTQTRDLIGANAAQEAAYTASKAGFNSQQVEYARLIGEQTDILKKYEKAIQDGKKAEQDRLRAQLIASITASEAIRTQMENHSKAMSKMAENTEGSTRRQITAIEQAANFAVASSARMVSALSAPQLNLQGSALLTFGQPQVQMPTGPGGKTIAQMAQDAIAQLDGSTSANSGSGGGKNSLAGKLSAARSAFDDLYKAAQPAKFALQEYVERQSQLELLLSKGKITQTQYNEALAQSSINYAAAIKGVQGLTQAEQYRAQLERQLQTDRDENRINAAAVGMGDLQTERARSQIQLVRDTNTTIQNLMTERDRTESEREKQALQRQIDLQREYLPKRIAEMQNGWAQVDQDMLNPINGWTAAVQNFGNQARDIAGQTEAIFSSAFNNISTDITSSIMSGSLSFNTLGDIANNVVRDIIGGFVKMGVQMGVNAALNATLGTAAAGQSMILAGTTATAWAPAAAMASLATLGANSVPAAAALTSTTALATSLAVIPGFATGGYVSGAGTGTSDSIMARLSDGEFVVNAAATKRNRALLEAINSNERVSVAGRSVAPTDNQRSGQSGQSGTAPQVKHEVYIYNNSNAVVQTRTGENGQLEVLIQAVEDRFRDQVATGSGGFPETMEQFYRMQRNAN